MNLKIKSPLLPVVASASPGSPPMRRLAEMVFDAIENEQFYILSHKGTKAQLEKRMNTIVEGGNPNVTGLKNFPSNKRTNHGAPDEIPPHYGKS
jgi:hypothetical protein